MRGAPSVEGMNSSVPKRYLVAAVLTAAGGVALLVVGWWLVGFEYRDDWSRLADGAWWASSLLKGLGFLAFGKAGFKIALVCVVALIALGAKLRLRRRAQATDPDLGEQSS